VSCGELEELAAELALGTVSGAQRAAALDHLAGCASCRDLVDDLGRVADGMLQLAPATEPPPGFESKVLARMGVRPAPVVRMPVRRRVLVGVAAVALVAAMSAGAATLLTGDDNARPQPREVRTALARDDQGRWTCRAVVYGDDPTWLVVSLDRTDGLTAAFSVEAVHAGASEPVPVGSLNLQDGHGTLAKTVGLAPGDVQKVRVLDSTGKLRYEVVLPES
jgi:hypothetical protein